MAIVINVKDVDKIEEEALKLEAQKKGQEQAELWILEADDEKYIVLGAAADESLANAALLVRAELRKPQLRITSAVGEERGEVDEEELKTLNQDVNKKSQDTEQDDAEPNVNADPETEEEELKTLNQDVNKKSQDTEQDDADQHHAEPNVNADPETEEEDFIDQFARQEAERERELENEPYDFKNTIFYQGEEEEDDEEEDDGFFEEDDEEEKVTECVGMNISQILNL